MATPKKGREMDQPIIELTPELVEQLERNKPPGGFKLPHGYLSHSQIEMYLKCPRQYYFRYIRDEKRPPAVAMTLGSSAHKAVETTHHHIVDHKTPAPIEMVLAAYSDTFDKKAVDVPDEEWQEEGNDKGSVKDAGVRLVTIYNRDFAPLVKPQVNNGVRGIEKKIEVSVAGVPMVGYIDLIDTNADAIMSPEERALLQAHGADVPEMFRTAVTDFKTKSKSVSQAEIDGSFQLTFYSYAEGISMVRYDQLLRQKKPKVKRMHSQRTQKDYGWMSEIVSSVAKAITAGIFPPCDPTSWACTPKWCGFYHMCRGKKR